MSSASITSDSMPNPDDEPHRFSSDEEVVCPDGYQLLEEVGRGGMGIVYRARDASLDRELALKFLQKRYTIHSTTAARFLEEARITAQLQHPGIPPIHQIGRLPDDRPFLAMKLVRGNTLAELLETEGPHPTRWLGIFEDVCQAVGYAHAHGVIHRDLKPANVMVGGHGEVQVMDWGLAKVLGSAPATIPSIGPAPDETADLETGFRSVRESDGSITQAGSVLGTPQFMPPEQAAGEVEKISERTDVFGLGAVLCVLLTGKPPFEGSSAETTRLNAVRGKTEAAFARLDQCGAEEEIVALCKRCLAFEPAQRPANGTELADAIAAIRLASEDRAKQAELERATAEVHAKEQLKRRKVFLISAGVAASILVLGIIGTTIGYFRAEGARTAAEEARADEAEQRTAAEQAKLKAQKRLETAIGMVDRMTTRVNSRTWTMNPSLQDERREILEAAVGVIAELAGDDSSDPLVRREIARANQRVADMYMLLGRQKEAIATSLQAIKFYDGLIEENPENIDDLVGASEARLTRGSLCLLTMESVLARQMFDESQELAERALKLKPDSDELKRRVLQSRTPRAYLDLLTNPTEGWTKVQDILSTARELGGKPDSPFLARFELGFVLAMVGTYSLNRGDMPGAQKSYHEAVEIFRGLDDRTAPSARDADRLLQSRAMATIQLSLAETVLAKTKDRLPTIADNLRHAIAITDGLLAIQPNLSSMLIQKLQGVALLAQIAKALGNQTEYEESIRQIRSIEKTLTNGKPAMNWVRQIAIRVLSVYAVDQLHAGVVDESIQLADELVQLADPRHISHVKYNAVCVYALGSTRVADRSRGEELAKKAIRVLEELNTSGYFLSVAQARNLLRDTDLFALHSRSDWREFLNRVAERYVTVARAQIPAGSVELASELANVSGGLIDCGVYPPAEQYLRESLSIREKRIPKKWETFWTQSLLGAALAGQKRWKEAEPLLLSGYEGLKSVADTIPASPYRNLFLAGHRLAELYDATDRSDKAAELRSQLPREEAPAARAVANKSQ